ncbi:dCTP deaminase [Endomicrobium proavitum]|uniref:dCTP deaminase n=1 Tax=Endomicrobium proavitum TaxID=1408281 RepID=A0A0G3WJJ6_9BACT|nr:dCTP deaminase [Endomicrobium proavitum]AKL98032.1 Deoxycytidine triphosphate deaminase [Endomicrobium proavitum]
MVKSDKWIIKNAQENKIIEPFEAGQVKKVDGRGVISYGTSSYGYDMRLSDEFMVIKSEVEQKQYNAMIEQPVVSHCSTSQLPNFPTSGFILDPKNSNDLFEPVKVKDYIVIPPNSIVLGKTIEYFRIPRDVVTIAFGKSTYARCGIFVNVTPFEPEWEGYVTLSIANTINLPVKVYANEGIAQVLFLGADEVCEISYADRKGKYQAQKTITQAKI